MLEFLNLFGSEGPSHVTQKVTDASHVMNVVKNVYHVRLISEYSNLRNISYPPNSFMASKCRNSQIDLE